MKYVAMVAALLTVIVFLSCAYTVGQHEQAIILAFGEVVGKPIDDPGLHFKVPWYDARKIDKRWLAWDGDPNQITTRDKRYILIDVFARWRIVDPRVFIEKLSDEESAQGRLDDILDSATRNVIANYNLIEAIRSTNRVFEVSDDEQQNLLTQIDDEVQASSLPEPPSVPASDTDSDSEAAVQNVPAQAPAERNRLVKTNNAIYHIELGRQKLTNLILDKAQTKTRELGIELKDVQLKRIDYIASVRQSVFERMISERRKVAARLRAQGDGLSAEILGRKDRDLKQIQSEAYKTAEEIKGKADAEAARIYAEAYKQDPELYQFLKTLDSYRNTLGQKTWLLLTTGSDYGKYLKSMK